MSGTDDDTVKTLDDAIGAHFAESSRRRREKAEAEIRGFRPDPQLERDLTAYDRLTTTEGRQPHLPAQQVARLEAYRNRRAAAQAVTATATGDEPA